MNNFRWQKQLKWILVWWLKKDQFWFCITVWVFFPLGKQQLRWSLSYKMFIRDSWLSQKKGKTAELNPGIIRTNKVMVSSVRNGGENTVNQSFLDETKISDFVYSFFMSMAWEGWGFRLSGSIHKKTLRKWKKKFVDSLITWAVILSSSSLCLLHQDIQTLGDMDFYK